MRHLSFLFSCLASTCLASGACSPTAAERAAGPAPLTVAGPVTGPVAGPPAAREQADALAAGSASGPAPDAAAQPPATFAHALLISVDGLRSDALRAQPSGELPGFRRLLNGAATLNARTDPDYTVTLPNHTDMITGRPVLGPRGHSWVKNEDALPGETLHKNHGGYVPCMFDVAHDRGFYTALFAGKTKFSIYDASYDAENGAPAATEAASATDHGRRKIDVWKFAPKTDEIADLVIASLGAGGPRSLVFAHYAVTDLTGHDHGWDVTPRSRYMKAVAAVDKEIGRILDAIEANPALRGQTVVLLTSDHGGGAPFKSHDQTQMWVDYIIPFLVWTGDGAPGGDLYVLNAATRRDPGIASPRTSDPGPPPIRNGDAGNLLLSLLGLPSVPGSTFDAGQELKIR
jgi:hypothetical protein